MLAQEMPYSVNFKAVCEQWLAEQRPFLVEIGETAAPILIGLAVVALIVTFVSNRRKGKGAP